MEIRIPRPTKANDVDQFTHGQKVEVPNHGNVWLIYEVTGRAIENINDPPAGSYPAVHPIVLKGDKSRQGVVAHIDYQQVYDAPGVDPNPGELVIPIAQDDAEIYTLAKAVLADRK